MATLGRSRLIALESKGGDPYLEALTFELNGGG
jgi:hypothetical protein